jgi:hypothetical protein
MLSLEHKTLGKYPLKGKLPKSFNLPDIFTRLCAHHFASEKISHIKQKLGNDFFNNSFQHLFFAEIKDLPTEN